MTGRGLAALALLLVTGCQVAPVGETSGGSPASSGEGRALRVLLDAERVHYGAAGALAVVRVGDQRWAVATGAADSSGTPLEPTDTFRIASITKPIVAALMLEAVDRGEVSLDDVVGDLLPGTLRPRPAVTVRMLLNHTSGIFDEGNEGDPAADAGQLEDPVLAQEARGLVSRYPAGDRVIASDRLLVALAETHDRYFRPGTGYHYSNINYQLAAMVLERVTGIPLADLLRTRIVEPLGLRHTTIAPPDLTSPTMRGYVPSQAGAAPVDLTDDLVAFGNGGNGGVISTADDLASTLSAIVQGRLFSSGLVTAMTTPAKGTYGLGLAVFETGCGVFYGHGGAVNGTGSVAMVSADGDDAVVVAQNLLTDSEADLPGLAERLVCSAVG